MNIIFLLNIFLYSCLLNLIKTNFKTITLIYDSNNFYIPIKLHPSKSYEPFIFSNTLPINFFPSSKCEICKSYKINENDTEKYKLINKNITIPYYSYEYIGDEYQSNMTLGDFSTIMNFVAFDNITFVKNYQGRGRFSLSFLNYNFPTEKKIFALLPGSENYLLHLGGYDENIIQDQKLFKNFDIIIDNNNSTKNIYKKIWYINFNTTYIDNHLSNETTKLSFDLSTNYLHIPKNYFFNNMEYIFPAEAKCQVQPEGYFLCFCFQDYETKFGNFKFIDDKGQIFYIKSSNYIYLESTWSENYCYVLIEINYDNDLFIAGKYIMNNYYLIFDINSTKLGIYDVENDNLLKAERAMIIFFLISTTICLLSLGGYFMYKKCIRNGVPVENEIEENIENNDERENENQENNININNEMERDENEQLIANNND